MTVLLKGDLKKQLNRCKQAQVALSAGFAVIAAGLFLFVIRPAMQQLDQAHKRYQKVCWELQQDQAEAGKLPEVLKQILALQQRVEKFDKKLPRQHDAAPFIRDVTQIREDLALKKWVIQPDTKPRRTDEFVEWPYKFTFEGDFQAGVIEFLRRTEDMPRLTRIQKLDIKASDSHDGQVRAEMTMNIYFAED